MSTISMRVAQVETLNPLIRRFTLQPVQGGALPTFDAGAHVRVRIGTADEWRHYSLIDFSTAADAGTAAPLAYAIAVRLEDAGRGGSRFMHNLQAGDVITIEPPRNDFPLAAHGGCAVLVAGGIGVTPLASMAARCRAQGRPVRMVYAGRSSALMALLPELQTVLGDALRVHTDEEAGASLDVDALLDACAPEDRLYVCGPQPLLDAVLAAAHARAWPSERVHFELFTASVAQAGDHAFEVVLSQSGQQYTVPADQTILECLIDHGCDPLFDCKRGECGICAVSVTKGVPLHRDMFLSDEEKQSERYMCTCVSWGASAELTLDI